MADPTVLIAIGSAFGALAIPLVLFVAKPPKVTRMNDRLRAAELYRLHVAGEPLPGERPSTASQLAALASRMAERLIRGSRKAETTEKLDRAGLSMSAQEWLILRCSGAIVGLALVLMLSGSLLLALPLGFLLSWLPTALFLRRKAAKRCALFEAQMPDVMQLVASSLRSGFSLGQALDGVVREGTQPAAGEIGRALAETRLGVELETALDKTAARMSCQDLEWAIMAMRISRQVGGNLAEVLLTTVHTMRERAALKRQVRSLSAEGRLSAYVLVAMPIGIGLWLFMVRRDYVRPLYTTGIGIGMLIAATGAMLFGSWWLSRVVKVEV
jgi:tight adherence protein B